MPVPICSPPPAPQGLQFPEYGEEEETTDEWLEESQQRLLSDSARDLSAVLTGFLATASHCAPSKRLSAAVVAAEAALEGLAHPTPEEGWTPLHRGADAALTLALALADALLHAVRSEP